MPVNPYVIGGKTEVGLAGEPMIDLSRVDLANRPVIITQGSTVKLKKDGTYIVDTGFAGSTTRFVLGSANKTMRKIRIRNRTAGAVVIEPNGVTLELASIVYTLSTNTVELESVKDTSWYITVGA